VSSGKRGGRAAVQIAVDMANEGLVSRAKAIHMVTPEHLDIMLHPQFKVGLFFMFPLSSSPSPFFIYYGAKKFVQR